MDARQKLEAIHKQLDSLDKERIAFIDAHRVKVKRLQRSRDLAMKELKGES